MRNEPFKPVEYEPPKKARITPEQLELLGEIHPYSLWLLQVFDKNFAGRYPGIMENSRVVVDKANFREKMSQEPPILPVMVACTVANAPPKEEFQRAIDEELAERIRRGERGSDLKVVVMSISSSTLF